MIIHENSDYRIYDYGKMPLPIRFNVIQKLKDGKHTHLIDIGWYTSEAKAFDGMREHQARSEDNAEEEEETGISAP